jgi:hypothetical protein
MLCGERLPRHLGPDPGPLARRNRPVTWHSSLLVGRGDPPRHLNPKPGGSLSEILNGTSAGSRLDVGVGQISVAELFRPLGRHWIHPGSVQSPHLRGGHRIAGLPAITI